MIDGYGGTRTSDRLAALSPSAAFTGRALHMPRPFVRSPRAAARASRADYKVVGDVPAPDSARCPAGFQCLPNGAWARGVDTTHEMSVITDQYGFDGACVPCSQGQYCPENTTNVAIMQAHMNICPPGYNCRRPSSLEPCAAGHFCNLGTSTGGEECSSERLREGWQEWAQSLHCPEGSFPDERGILKFLCPAGSYCPNATSMMECPPGSWCPVGVNESTPCHDSVIFGQNATERCPGGSRYEPSWPDHLMYLLAVVLAVFLLLEVHAPQNNARACSPMLHRHPRSWVAFTSVGRVGHVARRWVGATNTRGSWSAPR